jgi:lysophospholipase L1-like esterase
MTDKKVFLAEIPQLDTIINDLVVISEKMDGTPTEKVVEVLDGALDTAIETNTLYIHKVTSGSSTYVKGVVLCAGSNNGFTQFRFRRSGGVEYRTGTGNPISWGNYTANGNWIMLATKDEIPDTTEGWHGKTYISHGDSITWQDGQPYGENEPTARGYQTVLKEKLSLGTHTNKGVNGATLADRAGVSVSGVSTIKSIASYASYDLCTIAFGTNDFKQGVPLGTLGVIGDSNFDLTTFYGAYREAIEYILTSNPEIQLVLLTPLQRNQHNYDVNTVNSQGLKLIDYVNAVKQVGQLYSIPVCDLYSVSGITQLSLATYTRDGLHPNDDGYDRIGRLLARFLKSGFGSQDVVDLSEYVKVVDSALSSSSTNPVQNKVVKKAIDDALGDIETLLSQI